MAAVLAALYLVVALSPLVMVAALWLKGDMTLMHETGTSTSSTPSAAGHALRGSRSGTGKIFLA